MIHGLQPYSAMKDSGVPWMGKVPEHWLRLPGRVCFVEKKTSNTDLKETTVLSLSYGQIVVKPPEKLHGLVPASFETYQIIEPNDIVIRPTDLQNDWNSLRFGIASTKGIITSAYMCFRPKPLLTPQYGHLLLHTYDLKKVFYGLGSGLRQNLDWRDFKYLPCLVPPLDEQSAIVRFLDHADRRIRRYIRTKQNLIKLLEEQKQAIIHRAVTRGLDPSIRFKSSGIEWLGDVPEHWEVVRLGRVIQLTTGFPFRSDGFTQNVDDTRLLRGINIAPGRIRWEDIVYWPVSQTADFLDYELCEGDVVLGMDRPIISGGVRVAQIGAEDVPSLVLQRVARIRAHAEISAEFLLLLLGGKSFADYLAPIFTGISVPHISPEQIGSFRIALPSLQEQLRIVRWLKSSTAALEGSIEMANKEILFLREYRIRLIADVVTGKLDVREAAAKLPDESDEPEVLDDTDALPEGDETADGALDFAPEEAEA